jgi:hypothetical protein
LDKLEDKVDGSVGSMMSMWISGGRIRETADAKGWMEGHWEGLKEWVGVRSWRAKLVEWELRAR